MTKRMIDADVLVDYLNDKHDKVICGCTRSFIFTAKEKINELVEAQIAENNAEIDPWCYDVGMLADIYDLHLFLVADDDVRLDSYDVLLSQGHDPIAWMPIPQPKGNNNGN